MPPPIALAMTPSLLASHRADRVLEHPFSFQELLTRYTHWPEAAQRCGKDARAVFFDKIEPGMYRVRYLARATSVGSFVVPPTRIEAMYAPEVYGRTAASTLTVRAKP